jgi:hypothetical protein
MAMNTATQIPTRICVTKGFGGAADRVGSADKVEELMIVVAPGVSPEISIGFLIGSVASPFIVLRLADRYVGVSPVKFKFML